MNEALRRILNWLRYPIAVMLVCVRWYEAYPLSLRQIDETIVESGVVVDHAAIHRWSIKSLPVLTAVLTAVLQRCKRSVVTSWRLDESGALAVQ